MNNPSKKLKVINLFGAPGFGKSSVRSGLFWLMKSMHMSVEEVSEYAKYLVLTGRTWQLQEEQLYLFSKQHHKQLIIERSGYEYAATDSPLQLCSFYAPSGYYSKFEPLVDQAHERFDNYNFFLTRNLKVEEFEERGRLQTMEMSLEMESKMKTFLKEKSISYIEINVDMYAPWNILNKLGVTLNPPDFNMADFKALSWLLAINSKNERIELHSHIKGYFVKKENTFWTKQGFLETKDPLYFDNLTQIREINWNAL